MALEETSIAKGLRSVAGDYDAACKRLLAERQVLSRILKGCLDEFSEADLGSIERDCLVGAVRIGTDPVDRDEVAGRVLGLAGEDATVAEGTVTFDVRFDALVPGAEEEGDHVHVEVNVEAQSKFKPGYPLLKRALYYCGRLISMQGAEVVSKSRYGRLRKVVSVWVCTHPDERHTGTATSFRIEPRHLAGNGEYPRADYDLLEVVMLCLNSGDPGSSGGVLGMLEVLLATGLGAGKKIAVLRDGYGMIMTDEMSEGVDEMCNLSEGVLEEGREQGRKEGREQGRKEERKRFLEAAVSLVRDGLLGSREAAERFGFSEDDLMRAL